MQFAPKLFLDPVKEWTTRRYFLDKQGVLTQRMASNPGIGHYDADQVALSGEVYNKMAKLGFAFVVETVEGIHSECHSLTRQQKDYLVARSKELGLSIIHNGQSFESLTFHCDCH